MLIENNLTNQIRSQNVGHDPNRLI